METATCPNCSSPVADHPENGCVLAALIQVVRERGNLKPEEVTALHANADTDSFWNAVGSVVDELENGGFSE